MADANAPAADILIIPEGRRIEKKTHCGNCRHGCFGQDAFRAWVADARVKAEVEHMAGIVRMTGLQLAGFDDGMAALAIARLTREGRTQEEAMVELEHRKLAAAVRQMESEGLDWVWADQRMTPYRKVWELMRQGAVGVCKGPGVDRNGNALNVGAPLYMAYHCQHWSGAEGWTLAHDPDRRLDPLPAELEEMADAKAKPV